MSPRKKRAPPGDRKDREKELPVRLVLALILLFSFGLGVVCLLQFRDTPFFIRPVLDEASYVRWAIEIARGDVLGDRVFYQDPLYPYFLALIFRVFGIPALGEAHLSWTVVRLLQVMMGTATTGLVFYAGRKIAGDPAGLAAALCLALSPTVYFFDLLLLKSSLLICLSALVLAAGVAAVNKPASRWRWPAMGAGAGLLCLLRGNFLLLLPLFALPALFLEKGEKSGPRLFRTGLLIAGILAVLLPVGARNYAVSGEFVLTTSQGGANFYIGNNEHADGLYVDLPFVRPDPRHEAKDFAREAKRRTGEDLTPSRVSMFWFKEGLSWIKENPGRALRLWLHKARLLVHNYEVPDNYSFYLVRDHFVPALWVPVLGFGALWGGALIGLVSVIRRSRAAWYAAIFAVAYPASLVPFFVLSRYRLAALPAIAVFAGVFIFWGKEKIVNRQWRKITAAAVFLAAACLVSFLPVRESRWPRPFCRYNIGNVYLEEGRPEKALEWFDKALQTVPEDRDIRRSRRKALAMLHKDDIRRLVRAAQKPDTSASELVRIGKRLEGLGGERAALRVYEKAVEKEPGRFWALGRLGYLYHRRPELRDLDRAFYYIRQALEIDPRNAELMVYLGSCHRLAGNYAEARKWWTRALEVRPGYSPAKERLDTYFR